MHRLALGTCLLLVLCGQAQARPRDEVIAGANRCAVISGTRPWLDCYYGAAQPVRAAQGMTPAPATQVQLNLQPPPAAGPAENLPVRNQAMAAAGRCAMADDRDWLACYYAAVVPIRALLGLPLPVPVSQPAQPPPKQPSRETSTLDGLLGISDLHIVSRMQSYSFSRSERFSVTLANGQVWQQLDGDDAVAHWRKPPGTYMVSITGGAFGSYNLSVRNNAGRFKVRRIS
jgi:hypothetical protein